ncbi:MAG: hypothetical protein K2P30_13015 [Lachnospiraceae bacterium]|nr:hypothetical protein [Lachnospiraceae bacterium]
MFGMKKVLMCMNNLNSQMQMLNTGFEAIVSGIKVLGEKIEAVEVRLDKVEARLDAVEARLDKVESRLDSMDEKIDMVEYHLGKEIQVTYQTALENKRGIETLSRHFDGEICKITELSGRFDEFQRKCVGA